MPGLSITRKRDEKILLVIDGKSVLITVSDIHERKVCLNFQGDSEVRILREELVRERQSA
jgi:sRNA-binding carbon storage regulator CsrA